MLLLRFLAIAWIRKEPWPTRNQGFDGFSAKNGDCAKTFPTCRT